MHNFDDFKPFYTHLPSHGPKIIEKVQGGGDVNQWLPDNDGSFTLLNKPVTGYDCVIQQTVDGAWNTQLEEVARMLVFTADKTEKYKLVNINPNIMYKKFDDSGWRIIEWEIVVTDQDLNEIATLAELDHQLTANVTFPFLIVDKLTWIQFNSTDEELENYIQQNGILGLATSTSKHGYAHY